MNKQSGYIEKKIDGKVRAFKFGLNAFARYSEITGKSLNDIFNQFDPKEVENTDVVGLLIMFRGLIFCGAEQGARKQKVDVNFCLEDVGDWIDDMEQDDFNEIVETVMSSMKLFEQVNDKAKKKTATMK